MEGKLKPDIFEDLLTKEMDQFPEEETGHQKAVKAFIKMKQKRKNAIEEKWDNTYGNHKLTISFW
jgi:hypothetical protein